MAKASRQRHRAKKQNRARSGRDGSTTQDKRPGRAAGRRPLTGHPLLTDFQRWSTTWRPTR